MKYTRRIIKHGTHSFYINIPKELKSELKFKEGQKVVLSKRGNGISIVDWPAKRRGTKRKSK